MSETSTQPVAERRGAYEISTDPERLDLEVIHSFLRTVRRSIAHSLILGWSPTIVR